MSRPADDAYVERVCARAVVELDRFLRRRTRPPDGAEMLIHLEIKTEPRLSAEQQRQIDEQLDRVRVHYRWAQCPAIFTVDPGLSEHTCEVTPREVDAADGGPAGAEAPQPPPVSQYAVLILRYGRHEPLTFAYVLTSRAQRVTLHRPDHSEEADTVADIVIPASMSGVPAGPLLAVWYRERTLRLDRQPHRPEIDITVNGEQIPLGRSQVITWSGTISYTHSETGSTTILHYELEPWRECVPSASTAPPSGDNHPHRVVLTTDEHDIDLDVQPPASDARPAARRFPLPAPAGGLLSHHDIHTRVLYTRADSADGTRRWHVKLLRCATPWHAEQLRDYLRNQAVLIDRVNLAYRGTPLSPPWAIAPVHVLSAGTRSAMSRPFTDYAPNPEGIRAASENRLSGWFGVPDQPQPDCYVVVASPELNRVIWATRRDSPGNEELRLFTSMAAALDTCHELGVAHGDINPGNVCSSDDHDDGYVLVDGDSVTPLHAVGAKLRFTKDYASREMIKRAGAGLAPGRSALPDDDVLLMEHDRFGFALVVLTALAGSDLVGRLLKQDQDGDRYVDHPERVRKMIERRWPGWEPLVAALTAPLEPNALTTRWSASSWLTKLKTAYEESLTRQRERPQETATAQRPAMPRDERVEEIRQRVHERGPLPRRDVLDAVIEEVVAMRLTVAQRAQRWAFVTWYLPPAVVLAFILVAVILDL